MNDDSAALANFRGLVRLFPLPNLVLFPQVTQGLHIFEPRYRQMMADTTATDMLMALTLLQPGWDQDYDGRPAIYPVACLGRVTQYELLPDGRYNLRLKGLSRIRLLEEVPAPKLYRVARAELIEEVSTTDLQVLLDLRRKLTQAVLPHFPNDGGAYSQLLELFESDTPLGAVCDMLTYVLPLPLEMKQQLLEEPNALVRAEIIASSLTLRSSSSSRRFPPEFSAN